MGPCKGQSDNPPASPKDPPSPLPKLRLTACEGSLSFSQAWSTPGKKSPQAPASHAGHSDLYSSQKSNLNPSSFRVVLGTSSDPSITVSTHPALTWGQPLEGARNEVSGPFGSRWVPQPGPLQDLKCPQKNPRLQPWFNTLWQGDIEQGSSLNFLSLSLLVCKMGSITLVVVRFRCHSGLV